MRDCMRLVESQAQWHPLNLLSLFSTGLRVRVKHAIISCSEIKLSYHGICGTLIGSWGLKFARFQL